MAQSASGRFHGFARAFPVPDLGMANLNRQLPFCGGALDPLLIRVGVGAAQLVVEVGHDEGRAQPGTETGEDLQEQHRIQASRHGEHATVARRKPGMVTKDDFDLVQQGMHARASVWMFGSSAECKPGVSGAGRQAQFATPPLPLPT